MPDSVQVPNQGIAQLIASVGDNLAQISEVFSQDKSVTPKDKQSLASIMSQYQGLIENLGQPPGKDVQAPQEPVQQGPMPLHAGANPVSQAY